MLDELKLSKTPFPLFESWVDHAITNIPKFQEPTAMSLSTLSPDKTKLGNRMVLLKKHDEAGFVFYTNYNSRKARDLDANPFCSLVFYWPTTDNARSCRIEGTATKLSRQESEDYFRTRPRGRGITL